jgi:hypothetical protein
MDLGQFDLAELSEHLLGQAWVKVCLVQHDGGWQVLYLDAVLGVEPPSWNPETWTYSDIVFTAFSTQAGELARAFSTTDDTTTWDVGELHFNFPPVQSKVAWTHEPSYGPTHDWHKGPQPAITYQVHVAMPGNRQMPNHKLVGSGPSFNDSRVALNAFLTGDYVNSRDLPMELAHIRCPKTAGWLGPMNVTVNQLTVEVDGTSVSGAILEMYSETERSSTQVEQPGVKTFPLPNGTPKHLWVWLKRGTDWLDYRAITPWVSAQDLEASNIVIDVPQEPQAVIEALVYGGEGPQVEFKSCLPWQGQSGTKRPFKTIVAFANGDGGTIVYGVDRDEMTIVGLADDTPASRDRLGQMICSQVIPKPHFIAEYHTVESKTILVVRVERGDSPPYGLISERGSQDKPEFYVRRGGSTYHAHPADLRTVVASRLPAAPTHRLPWET